MNDEEKVTYFAETDSRNRKLKFGIKQKDRSKHVYVIGKTGMGKSTLLENLAVQDIQSGNGLAFIDPHGKTADLLLEYIPKERINDVVYFAPFDMEYPVSFNVMEDVGAERRHLVASGLMSAFKKIWVDAWSARMEYILGNIMLALLEFPGSTLIGVNRMLADKDFRKRVVDNITDPSVKSFWVDEYAKYTDKFAAEAAPAIQNKVGQFVANPLVRNIIGQPKSTFDIRKIMDEKKILIINLSKGRVGESNANLLGSMLITKIYLAAMSRADLKEKELKAAPHFYLYVDEFQSFANESFADILSEARKYKLNLTVAHQYIEQMSEEVRAAVFGNVGTMITFRVGAYDAEVLEKEFAPQFTAVDIVNLQKYQMYLKLMIDEVSSPPFSASGMLPISKPDISYMSDIIEASRKNFARPRDEVEDEIRRWHEDKFIGPAGGGGGSSQGMGAQGAQGTQSTPRKFTPTSASGGASSSSSQPRAYVPPPLNSAPQRTYTPPQQAIGAQTQSSAQSTPSSGERSAQRSDTRGSQSQGTASSNPRSSVSSSSVSSSSGTAGRVSTPLQKENRETELRKAISLSYLKTEPEPKNDQKVAKPENIAALRDALLTVMKDAKVDTTQMEQALKKEDERKPQQSSQPSSQSAQPLKPVESVSKQPQKVASAPIVEKKPEVKIEEKPEERREQPQPAAPMQKESPNQEQKKTFSEAAASQVHDSDPHLKQAGQSQQRKSVAVEVPEEILKKILNVND